MRVGAIDCGTNSIRLLIADSTTEVVDGVEKTVLKDVVREMRIVRLGQGVDATGWLAQEALDRNPRCGQPQRLRERHPRHPGH